MAQKKGELIVGLDIGTTKICCIVGEVGPEGIDVIGIGTHPSRGLRKGVVINIEATVSSIRRAVEEAELMAGCEIASVYAGIAGGHIRGFNSQGVVAVKEKELGVALVDVGGGTTDVAIFSSGAIQHTSVIPLGGNHLTNDIAVGLRTPMNEAERIKVKYGSAQSALLDKDETIEVPSVGGRAPRVLARRILCEIIEPRVEELFQLVHREVQKAGQEDLLASGVVLTGGSTLLHGMPELAEEVLGLPARRGLPRNIGGLTDVVKSPQHATAVGLLLYGSKQGKDAGRPFVGDGASIKERFLVWVRELF